MSNSFGTLFQVSTFGESHGAAIGCIVSGCPANFPLSVENIQPFLDKRKPGQSAYTSQRRESDQVQILSGVFAGKTTGSPIALLIPNEDARSSDYETLKNLYRPGHADFTYQQKYGHRDYRGGGRASARETAARVAAGAIARLYLKQHLNIDIIGYLEQIGTLKINFVGTDLILQNNFFCPNVEQISAIEKYITTIRREGDSIGARIAVVANNVPVGVGEPVFSKLNAELAFAMMSINAVKGVEIGDGFNVVSQKGSEHRDEMTPKGFLSNHAGGILGGIATGAPIKVSLALKPTSSIMKPAKTITMANEETIVVTKGRHDPCVGIRAVPIAEAMMALVLMDLLLIGGFITRQNNAEKI